MPDSILNDRTDNALLCLSYCEAALSECLSDHQLKFCEPGFRGCIDDCDRSFTDDEGYDMPF